MIGFDEAVAIVAEAARPLGSERVAIGEAAGRVIAAPVVAMIDSPPADSSAMDGYAVRDSDVPGRLMVVGESFAGRGFEGHVQPGCAVRIFTGAAVPNGAERVIVQEVVEREGDTAIIAEAAGPARHIRPQGSDFRSGDTLLPSGRRLDPRALVTAAGADAAEIAVWRRPRVAILATGDELASPGEARLRAGAVPESVSLGVAALAGQWGGLNLGTRRLGDELAAMVRAAGDALEAADLVVVTGGASVGEKDFAKAMFAGHRLELLFSKVAIKPGKPVWLGQAAGRLVIGLPGNPTSAMVTARLLLAPLVAGLSGADTGSALRWREARLLAPLAACGDRETFVRARAVDGGVGPLANQDSSAQRALAEADLLVRRQPGAAAAGTGEFVTVLDF